MPTISDVGGPAFHPWGALTLILLGLHCPPLLALTPLPSGDADHAESASHIFLPDELAFIDVTLSAGALDSIFADPWSDDYHRCSVRFHNTVIDEVVDDVGIRLRGNTSRAAIKKSWKLSFNTFVPGRKFHGLEKMNVNGEHNDVSIIRSRLAWKLYEDVRVPSSRAHHAQLNINDGVVEGLHIHVEQVDEELVQAWFGNKDGSLYKCLYKGARADLRWIWPGTGETYANLGGGETYQEQNLDDPDHEDLAAFIDFVNNTSDADFATGLGERFSLDNFLRAMAVDVVIGHWDNYWFGANNYYLYHNTASDRFEYIPYDLDNTYGVDFGGIDWATRSLAGWGDGGYGSEGGQLPPLIGRILAVDAFRTQLERYARHIVEDFYPLAVTETAIDAVYAMISPYAFTGSYDDGNMDWTYTTEMFHESYTFPEEYRDWGWGWDYGLKPYIEDRTAFLLADLPHPPPLPALFVNEFQAANDSTTQDEWGEYDDWIEIYNGEVSPIEMGGKYLSDTIGEPTRFRFPEFMLAPGEFLLVWCDDDLWQGDWHAGFKLSAPGEEIGLFHDALHALAPLDTVSFGPQAHDASMGRFPDGYDQWQIFRRPTPGESNDTVAAPWSPGDASLRLNGAWPNPTPAELGISFSLGASRDVKLRILTVDGREVATVSRTGLGHGAHELRWDGRDEEGRSLPAGLYHYVLRAGDETAGGKILILR